MPSPADRRATVEVACRGLAIALLAVLAWRAGAPSPAVAVEAGSVSALAGALGSATVTGAPSLDLRADAIPDRGARAWLAALARTGTRVRWRASDTLPHLALAVEPSTRPDAGMRVTAAGRAGRALRVADAAGPIDSVETAGGLHQVDAVTTGAVHVAVGGSVASAVAVESTSPRAVLVIARAGWEGRFVATALQEAGWPVEVDYVVTDASAPGARGGASVRTRDGAAMPDTARHTVVVALDASAASRAGALARFVRAGGGLVLSPGALAVPALAGMAPASEGRAIARTLGALRGATPRAGLDATALERLRPDAVVLERRGTAPVVVARREQLGRVALVGWHDTWQWRMAGGDDAPQAHARWWSAVVGSVAPAALATSPSETAADAADPAPYADLVARLGPPGAAPADAPSSGRRPEPWLLAAALLLLLAEWTSRRTRGTP